MEATRPTSHKMTTAQLKKALQKIKQTQIEVLLALKNQPSQIEQQHLNDSKVRLYTQSSPTNGNYMKSISQLNLLKMTEVNNMKKQWQRERERYNDKLSTLQQTIRLLEGELELKTRMEAQWNNQKVVLQAKVRQLQQTIMQIKIQGEDMGSSTSYETLIDELEKEMRKIRQEKNMLSSLVKKISENAFRSGDDSFTLSLKEEMTKVIGINQKIRSENEQYKLTVDGLKLTVQSMRYELEKFHSLLEKEGKQKKAAIQQQGRMQRQIKEREEEFLRQQQKMNQVNYVIHNNSKNYETDMNLKQSQNTSLRQQIDKNVKQLRNLRQVAYSYQVLTVENENLKRKLMQVNSTIIHLWSIKEAEYGNIYSILADLRRQ